MVKRRSVWSILGEVLAILVTGITHWVVYYFAIINACKTRAEAAQLNLKLPKEWAFIDNLKYVWNFNNRVFLRSFFNSVTITVLSIIMVIFVASMAAWIMQRRGGFITKWSDKIVLAGLTTPLAVVPTFWVLRTLHLNNTIPGIVLVEVALIFPFSCMLYKDFCNNLPREIDEAAIIDGCGPLQLFFRVAFPLMKPITSAIIILRSLVVYNDFTNPMYFLQGSKSSTVQLTIYLFQSTFVTDYGRLFTAVLLVCIPPVLLFLLLNKQIMEGVTMGAVKG